MSDAGPGPDVDLAAWTAALVGASPSALRWRPLGPREGPTAIWIVEGGGASLVIKAHARGRGFAQEDAAYRALAGPLRRWLPARAASDARLGALALARIAGEAVEGDGAPAHHRAAGEFLRALHEVPAAALGDPDPLPLEAAIERRWRAALAGAAALLGPEGCARLAPRVRPRLFRGAARVIAHRDFAPANWIAGADDRLHVVDLEHCRPDLALVDRVILAGGAWRRRPELGAAFDAGYGGAPGELEAERLGMLRILDAVTTVTWARRRGPARRSADAEALLAALLGEAEGLRLPIAGALPILRPP